MTYVLWFFTTLFPDWQSFRAFHQNPASRGKAVFFSHAAYAQHVKSSETHMQSAVFVDAMIGCHKPANVSVSDHLQTRALWTGYGGADFDAMRTFIYHVF